MSKPNMNCGECPYWLAYGEPETTDEMNRAIEEHCAECDACDGRCLNCDYFDPYKGECSREEYSEARECLDKMMRAARQQIVLHKALHENDTKMKKYVIHIPTGCCYPLEPDGKTVIICGAHLTPKIDGKIFWRYSDVFVEKIVRPSDPFANH